MTQSLDESRIYEGTVKVLQTSGVGFLVSQELKEASGKDAFIDRNDVNALGLKPGDTIKAWVRMNDQGKPQCFDIQQIEPQFPEDTAGLEEYTSLGTFEGNLKVLHNGVGFIEQEQIKRDHGKDIFVDRKDVELHRMNHGDTVRCTVILNKENKPQGVNVEIVQRATVPGYKKILKRNYEGQWEDVNVAAYPIEAYESAPSNPPPPGHHYAVPPPPAHAVVHYHPAPAAHYYTTGAAPLTAAGGVVYGTPPAAKRARIEPYPQPPPAQPVKTAGAPDQFQKMQQLIEWLNNQLITETEFAQMKQDLMRRGG